jgi:hypothetical protein
MRDPYLAEIKDISHGRCKNLVDAVLQGVSDATHPVQMRTQGLPADSN